MKRLNLAIVGCGWAASWHVKDLAQLPELFTVAVGCDPDVARATEFCQRYGIPRHVRQLEEVLAIPEIDVVALCTPPMLHHPMTLQALAAGKHVVCEKPLTSSLALADSMAEAEKQAKARLMPVFQYRFGPGIAKVREVIRRGLAGRHYVSTFDSAKTRGAEYYRTEWRGKFATELGGVLVTQSIHTHDLMSWLLGPIAAVTGFKTTRVNPIEVEDCAAASLQMVDGSLVSLSATLGSVRQVTRIRMCFEHVTFERECDDDVSRPAEEPWVIRPRTEAIGSEIARMTAEVPAGRSWFAGQYEAFHRSLSSGEPFPVTIADARVSLELITAIYHAQATGTAVRLPIGPTHPRYGGWGPAASLPPAVPAGRKIAAV